MFKWFGSKDLSDSVPDDVSDDTPDDVLDDPVIVDVTFTFRKLMDRPWEAEAPWTEVNSWINVSRGYGYTREEALINLHKSLIRDRNMRVEEVIQKTKMEFSAKGLKEVTNGV